MVLRKQNKVSLTALGWDDTWVRYMDYKERICIFNDAMLDPSSSSPSHPVGTKYCLRVPQGFDLDVSRQSHGSLIISELVRESNN